jgi:eukaryotic-like serine/threonine-protein kinase
LSADPAFTDRFAREARAAARLTHVNVVNVHDQGHEYGPGGHHVFLVMELVEGRTLRELLRERGRLSVPEAVSIMEPVLGALASAHRAGLVHRDIKPENILLSDQGVVKVADFGLARAVESDPTSTRTGLMMGTLAYCAPEQLSRGFSDPRSDVYSAGIVLFELLTGSTPYHGESAMNVAYQHVHSRVPAPSSRVRGIPEPIDEVVVAATDSDPTGRQPDAGAFLAEIADVRTELQLPVTPVPPRPRGRRGPPGRSRRDADSDQNATASLDGQSVTTVVGRGAGTVNGRVIGGGNTTRLDALTAREGEPLPPPVVIPPPKAGRAIDPRRRRRRRLIIGFILVILLGLAAFFGTQALIRWRFAHVPKVSGLTRPEAVAMLRGAGYRVRVQPGPLYSETVPEGKVLRSNPAGGLRLATGKTVLLTLSAGPQRYQVPLVRGKSFDAARSQLAAIGPVRVVNVPHQVFNVTVPAGAVIRTDPHAGTQVTRSTLIDVWVSKGPPQVGIPDVSGLTFEQARHRLRKAGFATARVLEYNEQVPTGMVISTDPTGSALYGSTVTIRVSQGPHLVAVPAISIGEPVDQAEAALTAAGLVPTVSVVESTGGAGTYALYTDPRDGSQVPIGSTVTILAYTM